VVQRGPHKKYAEPPAPVLRCDPGPNEVEDPALLTLVLDHGQRPLVLEHETVVPLVVDDFHGADWEESRLVRIVSGIYHAAPLATAAVRALLGESVPADVISVRVHSPSGTTRECPVQDESGVLDGAWMGARIGAVAGALLMGGLAVGVPMASGDGAFVGAPFTAALRGGLGGAAAGVTLGGILGIGRWKGLDDLSSDVLEGSRIEVRVHSDELEDTAKKILERTGADELTLSGRVTR
jgi:hypothetical protein